MRSLAYVAYSLVLLAILFGLNRYVTRRLSLVFGLREGKERWLRRALLSLLGLMVIARLLLARFLESPLRGLLTFTSMLQLVVVLSALMLAFLHLAENLAHKLTNKPAPAELAASDDAVLESPLVLPRRSFLVQSGAGGALLIASSSSLYGTLRGRLDYQLEDVPIKIDGLHRAWDGFRIAQLSDVHIGTYVGEAELRIALELVRKAKPDLIVLTGDLLDQDARLAPRLGAFARRLKPLARYGVAAVSGNHDFYAGVEMFELALVSAGVRVLRNSSCLIADQVGGISLLGVDDVWGQNLGQGPDLQRALASTVPMNGSLSRAMDLPRVLLCHNPSYFKEAAGNVALQLSGHTHGGQINLPGRPTRLLLAGGWIAGRYEQGGSQLYVNRGFGTVGPPARLGAPPEVTRIVLTV